MRLGRESVTYAELDASVTVAARRLARSGAIEAGRVAAALPAGRAFVELVHAAARLGIALEPLAAGRSHAAAVVQDPLEGPLDEQVPLLKHVDAQAVHTVIRTSGTTGEAKAVELTYANHAASATAAADALGTDPGDAWLCPLPLHHVGGLGVLIRCAINHTTAVLHDGFDVDRVKAELEGGEITLASLVPTMLVRLREAGLSAAPGLRAIALGGGPIPAGLLEWAADTGIPVVAVYGMTETCSQVVAGSPGRVLAGAQLRIGDEGEILVQGPMVARGTLAGDGWLHTGDLGRLDADGLLHVEGRLKELIVSGGENVAPVAVERVLTAHPEVADAGVTGVRDAEWGELVVAWVVASGGADVDVSALDAFARARLAPHEVPKRYVVVDGLPRSAAGKLLRRELGY